MASKRCLPTGYFRDPDIMRLRSRDTKLLLAGLVLQADDEGRGVAYTPLLCRELDMLDIPEGEMEAMLADLVDNDLLILYQAGKHRYYAVTRWRDWQTISKSHFTPSRYPSPPPLNPLEQAYGTPDESSSAASQDPGEPEHAGKSSPPDGQSSHSAGHSSTSPEHAGKSSAPLGTAGNSSPIESNSSQSNSGEGEGQSRPGKVVRFPTGRMAHTSTTSGDEDEMPPSDTGQSTPPDERTRATAHKLATILRLPESGALLRIVADYQDDPLLSLLGEADAAREYIDDRRRNKSGQRMSPAFFRRWVKHEHEDAQARRQLSPRHTTAATGVASPDGTSAPPRAGKHQNLMHLADQVGKPPGQRGELPTHPISDPKREEKPS